MSIEENKAFVEIEESKYKRQDKANWRNWHFEYRARSESLQVSYELVADSVVITNGKLLQTILPRKQLNTPFRLERLLEKEVD